MENYTANEGKSSTDSEKEWPGNGGCEKEIYSSLDNFKVTYWIRNAHPKLY